MTVPCVGPKWPSSKTYAYDDAGNRTSIGGSFARTNLPAAITSAVYNAKNQPTAWNGATLTYDANGNLTSDGVNTYSWDVRNRLTSISGGISASFQYNPLGARTSKTVAGTTTGFLHDGPNVVQELSGGTPSANIVTTLTLDEGVTRTDASGASYPLTDALGSVVALTDAAGALQTQYTFAPFGGTTSTGATSANAAQFAGRENDGTGLYYMRARYYSPSLQRFISEDPIGMLGGGANLQTYVGNNPLAATDPSGLADPLFINSCVIGYASGGLEEFLANGTKTTDKGLSSSEAAGCLSAAAISAVWNLPFMQRGREIEKILGGNLPNGFPVIDKFVLADGIAISIKSVDLRSVTYQSASKLESLLAGYVNKLIDFEGATRGGYASIRFKHNRTGTSDRGSVWGDGSAAKRVAAGRRLRRAQWYNCSHHDYSLAFL